MIPRPADGQGEREVGQSGFATSEVLTSVRNQIRNQTDRRAPSCFPRGSSRMPRLDPIPDAVGHALCRTRWR